MSAYGSRHEEWADSIGAYLLEALPDAERHGFESHLEECAACRESVSDLRVASDALPASVEQLGPSPELKGRIMAIVHAEAELLAAAGPRADLPPEPARPARRSWLGGLSLRPGLALAAVLVLLVTGGVVGAVLSRDEGRTITATVERSLAENATAKLIVHDTDSKLEVASMPSPPDGRVYQVWLKRKGIAAPEPTSALFVPRADGSGAVSVPGSLEGVEAVLVTDEPEGGSSAPTREPVIAAKTA
jgi:anti-sigma-K factor RskA